MFIDNLHPAYIEERSLADAERFARLQQAAMERAQAAQPTTTTSKNTTARPTAHRTQTSPTLPTTTSSQQHLSPHSTLTAQLMQQRPPLSRPNSSGVLGGIFQGFVKAASAGSSPPGSQCPTPTALQGAARAGGMVNAAELERRIQEQKRDADICAMPTW